MELPTDAAILAFHKEQARSARAFEVVYMHSRIIADIAAELIAARRLVVDGALVHAAALLHDVGYYSLFDTTDHVPDDVLITHGVVGATLLREAGMPESIVRIAERHTGVGLTKKHILETHLPLPARDFLPETPEERLLMYADKLHTKSVKVNEPLELLGWFNTSEHYLIHARQFGEENAARFAALVEMYGTPNLEELSRQYGQPVA
jgi:uncharacterized protein